MDSSFKLVSRLLIICIVAGLGLGFVHSKAIVVISEKDYAAGDGIRKEVFSQAEEFVEEEHLELDKKFKSIESVYIAKKGEKKIGYVLIVNVKGYAGAIRAITGVFLSGEVAGFKVLESIETVGLGKRIEEEDFQAQFAGIKGDVALSSDGGTIEALSGATVSSKAAAAAANLAQQYVAAVQ